MRHLSICFLLSWFFQLWCLFCVIRFGLYSGDAYLICSCFLANRHVVVSYWLRLLTRFNDMYVSGCITALRVQNNTVIIMMFQIFYRSAMGLIAMPKCWPRAIILAQRLLLCRGWDNIKLCLWCMFFEPNNPLLIYLLRPLVFGWSHFMLKRSG